METDSWIVSADLNTFASVKFQEFCKALATDHQEDKPYYILDLR